MARTFSSKEAKELLQSHNELQEKLNVYCKMFNDKKQETINYIKTMNLQEIFSQYMLKSILKRSDTIISPEINQLISKLYLYKRDDEIIGGVASIRDKQGTEIKEKMQFLSAHGISNIRWVFTTKSSKEETEKVFYELKNALSGSYAWNILLIEGKINDKKEYSEKDVMTDFEINREKYYSILLALDLERVCSIGNIEIIKRLIDKYTIIKDEISLIEQEIDLEKQKEIIKEVIKKTIEDEVEYRLQAMPIEELNNFGNSIRVKTLRNAGYTNIGSVFKESWNRISSIYGISDYATGVIKKIANEYAEEIRSSIKIRLNYDKKTEDSTELVYNIYKYCRQKNAKSGIDSFKSEYQDVENDLETMRNQGESCRFFFLNSNEKQKIIKLFYSLTDRYEKKYKDSISEYKKIIESISQISEKDAWDDYNKNSIIYYNIIEELVPGVLGNDDENYGLSENLSNEVQAEKISLDGLYCELRRYQTLGVKYILHQKKVLLGDEMGLGKTIQAMACMISLRNAGKKYFMVVCPASVLINWCKEISIKSDLEVTKIHGKDKKYAFEYWKKHGGVAVTTYETTAYCIEQGYFRLDMLIVDEAHYIKNPNARRSINIKEIDKYTERMLFMTGTALENKVREMIELIYILQPQIAKDLLRIANISYAKQFREKIAPVYYRRKRENVLTELPDLIENDEWCVMSPQEESIYESTVYNKNFSDIRRVSWNVSNLRYSSKASRLKEIVEDAKEDGRKVIVFSFYLDTIKKIQILLGESCVHPINGSVSVKRRQEIIDEFDNAEAGAVLPAQILSAGTGLNIQSASVVVICEPQFKPSIENQAISRAYRMGQARNVHVHRLLCERTVDERLRELLNSKQYIFDTFADKSVAAERTMEVDEKSFGKIVEEEIERINEKRKKRA